MCITTFVIVIPAGNLDITLIKMALLPSSSTSSSSFKTFLEVVVAEDRLLGNPREK